MENTDPKLDPLIKSALEYDVASETRAFLKSLPAEQKSKRARIIPFYISGIAASFLILILSILSIGYAYNDKALAEQYQLRNFQERDLVNKQLDILRSANVQYNLKNYSATLDLLNTINTTEGDLQEHAEWLKVLCLLQQTDSNEASLKSELQRIKNTTGHLYEKDAKKLFRALKTPFRTLIVK